MQVVLIIGYLALVWRWRDCDWMADVRCREIAVVGRICTHFLYAAGHSAADFAALWRVFNGEIKGRRRRFSRSFASGGEGLRWGE